MLVLEKEFLSLEEVSLYFNENGFNFDLIVESDYWQISEIISDLVKENKLRVVIYYDGQTRLEPLKKLSREKNQDDEVKTAHIQGYFQSKSLIKSFGNNAGISTDFSYEAFKIFEFQSIYKCDPTAFTHFLIDNKKVHSNDLRFIKADLDIFFNNQPYQSDKKLQASLELGRRLFQEQRDIVTSLTTQLADALTIIEKNKSKDLDSSLDSRLDIDEHSQSYDWQNMNEYTYPPELHLAIEIWEKYYKTDASKNITQFDTGRFNSIAIKINLKDGNLKDRIRTILTPLESKIKAPSLIKSLKAIDMIHTDKIEQD